MHPVTDTLAPPGTGPLPARTPSPWHEAIHPYLMQFFRISDAFDQTLTPDGITQAVISMELCRRQVADTPWTGAVHDARNSLLEAMMHTIKGYMALLYGDSDLAVMHSRRALAWLDEFYART